MGKTPKKTHVSVYIPSQQVETIVKTLLDKDGRPVQTHYLNGSINGKPFSVPCDVITNVAPEVAEVIQRLLQKQCP